MSTKSRMKYTFLNIITTSVPFVLISMLGFLKLRVFIYYFGQELNGLHLMLFQVLGYLNLIEAGFGSSSIQSLYKPLAEQDRKRVSEIVKGMNQVYRFIGIIFIVLLLIAAFTLEVKRGSLFPKNTVLFAMLLIGTTPLISYFTAGRRLLMEADQKKYIFNMYANISKVISLISFFVLIHYRANYLLTLFAEMLIFNTAAVLSWYHAKKEYSWLDKEVYTDTSAIKNTKFLIVHQISGMVVFNTDNITVGLIKGFKSVSIFGSYSYIITALKGIFKPFVNSMTSSFGNLFAVEEEKSQQIYHEYQIWTFMFTTVIVTTCTALITHFVKLWISPDYSIGSIGFWYGIMTYFEFVRTPITMLSSTHGYFKETMKFAVMEMTINIALSIVFVIKLGIYGVLLATVIAFCNDYIFRSNYLLKKIFPNYRKRLLKLNVFGLLILLGLYGLEYYVIEMYAERYIVNLFVWFAAAVIVFAINILIVYSAYRFAYKEETIRLTNRIIGILRCKGEKNG